MKLPEKNHGADIAETLSRLAIIAILAATGNARAREITAEEKAQNAQRQQAKYRIFEEIIKETPWAGLREGGKDLSGTDLAVYQCFTKPGQDFLAIMKDAHNDNGAAVEVVGSDIYVTFSDSTYFVANWDIEQNNFKIIRLQVLCDENGKNCEIKKDMPIMDIYAGIWEPGQGGQADRCLYDHLVADKFECDGKNPCRPANNAKIRVYNPQQDGFKMRLPEEPERDKRKGIKSARRYVKR